MLSDRQKQKEFALLLVHVCTVRKYLRLGPVAQASSLSTLGGLLEARNSRPHEQQSETTSLTKNKKLARCGGAHL